MSDLNKHVYSHYLVTIGIRKTINDKKIGTIGVVSQARAPLTFDLYGKTSRYKNRGRIIIILQEISLSDGKLEFKDEDDVLALRTVEF